jgi:hypothetical protein
VRKPYIFETYEGCATVLLWGVVIWVAMAVLLLAVWKWAT